MKQQSIKLTQMMEISNYGHILYIYDSIESYIENTIAFVLTGIEQRHHLLNYRQFRKLQTN